MPRFPGIRLVEFAWYFAQMVILLRCVTANSGLISRTLVTFQEASCEGEPMKMSCPAGTLISIQFAQFGRQVPSSEMCPPEIQSDEPGKGRSWRTNVLWEDTNCLATTSLTVILDVCQDQQLCNLIASTATFQQDPCPGTRKYLEVAYKCRPDEFSSETVCEGDQLELRCARGTRIAISSAMFGRTIVGNPKCPELLRNTSSLNTTCRSKDAIDELVRLCHGRKSCTIHAEVHTFGNPCPKGVNKYLNVVYTCVPKNVLRLKPLRRHKSHRKHHKHKTDNTTSGADGIPATGADGQSNIRADDSRTEQTHTTTVIDDQESFPADAAPSYPHNPGLTFPENPHVGESKHPQGPKPGDKYNTRLGKDNQSELGRTTPCMNTSSSKDVSGPSATGLLTDWLNAFNFMIENKEKAVLYLVLGVAFGVISLLFLVIIRLAIINKRKSRAKLDVSEPAHAEHPAPSNHIEAPTLERTDSVDRIEVVRFNPMRSRDFATCTLRSDIGNRSLTNYYG